MAIFKGNGIVMDPKKPGVIIARFEDGVFETEDKKIVDLLKDRYENDYEEQKKEAPKRGRPKKAE